MRTTTLVGLGVLPASGAGFGQQLQLGASHDRSPAIHGCSDCGGTVRPTNSLPLSSTLPTQRTPLYSEQTRHL